jgi:hypothetical protein
VLLHEGLEKVIKHVELLEKAGLEGSQTMQKQHLRTSYETEEMLAPSWRGAVKANPIKGNKKYIL